MEKYIYIYGKTMEFSSICIMRIINLIKFHSHNFSSIETSVLIHFELLEELNRSSPTLSFHSLWISKWIQKMLTPVRTGPQFYHSTFTTQTTIISPPFLYRNKIASRIRLNIFPRKSSHKSCQRYISSSKCNIII